MEEERKMNKKIVLILISLLCIPMVAFSVRFTSATGTLKVGVIGPYSLPQWHNYLGGMQGGAQLAMMDINAAGGINVGGTPYNIELVMEDEHAMPLDEGAAYTATMNLLTAGCKYIIGGFRTECVWKIIEAVKDWNSGLPDEDKVILFINGASTDELISTTVKTDYSTYWWLFRINPINSTMLFKNMLGYLQGYLIPYKLAPMYGGKVKFGCLVEDLSWTVGISQYMKYVGLGPQATYVYGARSPPGTTDFTPFLNAAAANNTRLLTIAYTLPDAGYLINQWRTGSYPFMIVGIDVFGQTHLWPSQTGGKCEYEVLEDFSGTRTPITPEAVKFWDHFVGNFSAPPPTPSAWPIYTAWGAYNGFIILKQALETADTFNSATVKSVLETQETQVLNGKSKFTSTHDVYSLSYGPTWPDGYTRAMMIQWTNSSSSLDSFVKNVVSPVDQLYSRKTQIPLWMYDLALWDLNFDGKVDVKDVARAAKGFGALPGDARWDIECDINLDGKIDVKDIAAVAKKFGARHEPWPLP
jgi:ABC-type branched-subunit amino acid transport system substrate-binding protein